MLFWWSVYASSLPVLANLFPASTNLWAKVGPAALGLLSPVFCTFLLTKVSGIPIHERNQKAKFGKNADYLKYVQNTPLLLPLPGLLRRDKQA